MDVGVAREGKGQSERLVGEGEVIVWVFGGQSEVEESDEVRSGAVGGISEAELPDFEGGDGELWAVRTVEDVHRGSGYGGEESQSQEYQYGPEATAAAEIPVAPAVATVVILRLRTVRLPEWLGLGGCRVGGSGGHGGAVGGAIGSELGRRRVDSVRHF